MSIIIPINTVKVYYNSVLILYAKGSVLKVVIKWYFKLLKAYLYLGVYLNFIFFFVRLING